MLKTTVAGSLPKPSWLAEPEKLWAPWKLEGEELWQGQCDAALIWIKTQEDAGIDIVTDGEQFRKHFVHGFLEFVDGIDFQKMTTMGIRDNRYDAEVPTVTSKISRREPAHTKSTAFCREHAKGGLKITMPGPMTICDTIADEVYGKRADMAMAFAEILNQEALELQALGVDVIQFDEPAFNVFLDDVKEWGVAALNRAFQGITVKKAVHICYGYGIDANNQWKETLGSEWRQYEETFPALNDSDVDQISLECAGSHVPHSLMALLKDKEVMVGSVDVANLAVETPEQVAEVIRSAMRYVDAERIYPCTNCGLAPFPRHVAEGKLKALAAGAAIVRKELGAA
ncbi:MAG: 5-methyltetrahydropteroyltriglutamate--homocysteine methyltransferase [Rhodospirillaceae bacterium]|nr:5-methyltetrahydropteroyltriglutamate--homocysteine methyltransferase [Rhodospirillaceae bacterium]|tara:strand:- start:855 stop:1880 length:1026 start_codon:yes stop_codon:yes gene_type:complete